MLTTFWLNIKSAASAIALYAALVIGIVAVVMVGSALLAIIVGFVLFIAFRKYYSNRK